MRADYPLAQLCVALGVSRAGYYAWAKATPSPRARADAALSQDIAAVYAEHRGRYGAPRIRHALRQRGQRHSTKRVARLLRQQGLRGQAARRYVPRTTDSAHAHPVAPNRLAAAPAPPVPIRSG